MEPAPFCFKCHRQSYSYRVIKEKVVCTVCFSKRQMQVKILLMRIDGALSQLSLKTGKGVNEIYIEAFKTASFKRKRVVDVLEGML